MAVATTGLYPIHHIVEKDGKRSVESKYVSLEEAKGAGYFYETEKKGKDALQKLLRTIRKELGSPEYREMIKSNGLSWEEKPHEGANTMLATMTAYNHLMEGKSLFIGDKSEYEARNVKSNKGRKAEATAKPSKPKKKLNKTLFEVFGILNLNYSEENDHIVIGDGHTKAEGKWGKLETEVGSIRLVDIEEVTYRRKSQGHFFVVDSCFRDKNMIKDELGGNFKSETKQWRIPFIYFIELLKKYKHITIDRKIALTVVEAFEQIELEDIDTEFTFNPDDVPTGTTEDDIDISNFVLPEGIHGVELYPHQKKGVMFMLENKRAILGLAVGLGKTLSTIVAVQQLFNEKKIEKALVVCPSSVKYNWKKEIEKFSGMTALVLSSSMVRGRKAEKTWESAKEAQILIANYDMLRNDETREELFDLAPNCIIADEAHKLKNVKAKQTKAFRKTWRMAEYKFFLTATPFPNGKPQETYTILSNLRMDKLGSWSNFSGAFVESTGQYSSNLVNTEYLKERMSDIVFIRTHHSKDVTAALPHDRHFTFGIEMTKEQKRLYKVVAEEIEGEIERLEKMGVKAGSPAVIAKLKKLESVALDPDILQEDTSKIDMNKLSPKEEWVVDMIEQHFLGDDADGFVVFSNMKLPIAKMAQGLKNRGFADSEIAYIMGGVNPEKRTEVSNRLERGEVKVVFCTSAAEEGVNLQKGASNLIHFDTDWTPKSITQREGRVLRQGSTSEVCNFFSPIVTNTVEDLKRAKVGIKVEVIEELLGNGTTGSVKNNITADQNIASGSLTFDDIRGMISADV